MRAVDITSDRVGRVPDADRALATAAPDSSAIGGAEVGPEVSIVVPVKDEAENVDELVAQIGAAMAQSGRRFELIVVDDGSADATAERLQAIAGDRPWLVPLYLRRNYGQSTALQAGFDRARGRYVATLDGDLQNDPADLPGLLRILDEDPEIDCVSGWRLERKDHAISRRLPSRIANRLVSAITGVPLHDYGCALKVYRAEIIEELRLYGEQHRFIPALAVDVGARVVEIPVNHRPRLRGRSKYGVDRTLRVLLDLLWVRFLMRFLHRPIHAFGLLGALLFGLGGLLLAWLTFVKLALREDIGGRPALLLGVLLVLVGVQLIATGVLGELLMRVYHEPEGRPQYLLRRAPRRRR